MLNILYVWKKNDNKILTTLITVSNYNIKIVKSAFLLINIETKMEMVGYIRTKRLANESLMLNLTNKTVQKNAFTELRNCVLSLYADNAKMVYKK